MPLEPIHKAAGNGDEAEVVRLLGEEAGRGNAQDERGLTPLMLAALKAHDAVVARLLALGADVGLEDVEGHTAVHIACGGKHASSLSLLLDAGASINACTTGGRTPLTFASSKGAADCVALLIARGGSMLELDGQTTEHRNTALHLAAQKNHPAIASLLLQAGADPTLRNSNGHTPPDIARSEGHTQSIALLETALAEPQRPRLLFKARALCDAAHEQRHISSTAGAGHRVVDTPAAAATEEEEEGEEGEDQDGAAAPATGPRHSSRIAARARVVAAAPAFLRGRVERRQPLPQVQISTNDEELTACLRFVLGLQGHGGWAGAEDERATMRTEGLFPELCIELLELLVPRWDGARQGRPLGEQE